MFKITDAHCLVHKDSCSLGHIWCFPLALPYVMNPLLLPTHLDQLLQHGGRLGALQRQQCALVVHVHAHIALHVRVTQGSSP